MQHSTAKLDALIRWYTKHNLLCVSMSVLVDDMLQQQKGTIHYKRRVGTILTSKEMPSVAKIGSNMTTSTGREAKFAQHICRKMHAVINKGRKNSLYKYPLRTNPIRVILALFFVSKNCLSFSLQIVECDPWNMYQRPKQDYFNSSLIHFGEISSPSISQTI